MPDSPETTNVTMTPDQFAKIQEGLDRMKTLETELAEAKQANASLVTGLTKVMSGTADEQTEIALMTATGLYDEAQAKAIIDARQDEKPGEEETVEDIMGKLGDDPGPSKELEEIRQRQDELELAQKKRRIEDIRLLSDRVVKDQLRTKIEDSRKELAEKHNIRYTPLGDPAMNKLLEMGVGKARSAIAAHSRQSGTLPTDAQVEQIVSGVIPDEVDRFRSVISDPALLRASEETGSGSVEDPFEAVRKDKPTERVDIDRVRRGELSKEAAATQESEAMLDELIEMGAKMVEDDPEGAV